MEQAKQDLLVMSAQKGNRQAFTCLYEQLNRSLLRFAYKICLDEQISQEAVQDTWIKIFKNLKQLNDPRTFKSWIFRAVRWRVLDLLRKQTRNAEQTLDESELHPSNRTDNIENTALLRMVNKLPDLERHAIYLFYLEDMKIREISNILEIPIGTVKSRLNRARRYLRENADNE